MEDITADAIQVGLTEDEGKFCADCKHLLGVRYAKEYDKWKCAHPNNIRGWKTDLVSGIKYRLFKIVSLDDLRNNVDQCGEQGAWYEKYVPPVREPVATIGGSIGTEIVFDDATIETNRKAAEERLKAIKTKKSGGLANIKATDL